MSLYDSLMDAYLDQPCLVISSKGTGIGRQRHGFNCLFGSGSSKPKRVRKRFGLIRSVRNKREYATVSILLTSSDTRRL
ncbi:hypothetical protein LFADAHJC_LOCUS2618 [Methylorubrum extorquens]